MDGEHGTEAEELGVETETCQIPGELALFWTVAIFILGSCIGSFLNVCIWRIPRGESVLSPPSHCPKCGHAIAFYENIPLLSWLLLLGKCSKCRNPISVRYFLVELMTGMLFAMLFMKVAVSGEPLGLLAPYFAMAMLAVTTAFIDCELRIIPDETTYAGMGAGLVSAALFPEIFGVHGRLAGMAIAVLGLAVAGGGMALAAFAGRAIFKREALGWGDVKYIAAVGCCLGVVGAAFTVLAGSVLGSVAGLVRGAVSKRRGRLRRPIAFGPFLAFGAILWMLFGERIVISYLELIHRFALR